MVDRITAEESRIPDQLEELQARALETARNTGAILAEASAYVKDYTQKQPARALGMALGMGVLLGWVIKRR